MSNIFQFIIFKRSYNIGEILVNNIDKTNALNQDFMIGNARRDGIGLGMSKSKFMKFEVG